ncbi:MAG TPA: glycosyl hydrolase family 8 [Opitutaceae bacterium]|nr:glycosyl hydrolase family 8 [Opitutaceae bacterium]
MKQLLPLLACCAFLGASAAGFAAGPGAFATGRYPNLFGRLLGKTDAEVDARVAAVWRQLFYGEESQRLFFPIAGDMAYIPDVANHDVRTEGLSYGMMICVQLDHRKEFDQIWRFAHRYMYHDRGPLRGYFTWHTAYDGSKLRDSGPAPDGEEWFVTALFFASHRWGDGQGIFNYGAQAQAILRTMLHKDEEPDRGPEGNMINRAARQVDFVPQGPGAGYTDPSYHLPAFYELWARWAASPDDRAFLAQLAPASRRLFRAAADPRTGLMPDICAWDGSAAVPRRHEFLYDAWRTLSNPAVDWSWWAADPWEIEQSNRVLSFLASQGPDCIDRFTLDGTPIGADRNSPGLVAMAASAALAADPAIARPFVERFWNMPVPTGEYRYYGGMLTLLATLELSGRFRIYPPPAGP